MALQLLDLPGELLLRVVAFLPVTMQATLAQVCRALRTLLGDSSLSRLQVARFHQRLALCRPVEAALLQFVRRMTVADLVQAAAILRQFAAATAAGPGVCLDTVVFHAPSGSAAAWSDAVAALHCVASVRSVVFQGCQLGTWNYEGLADLTHLHALVRHRETERERESKARPVYAHTYAGPHVRLHHLHWWVGVQAFEQCGELPAGLLPAAAALPALRTLRVSDAHLFIASDADTLSQLARLEELRLCAYTALNERGMAQARRVRDPHKHTHHYKHSSTYTHTPAYTPAHSPLLSILSRWSACATPA
jgi:hypothetical protein